VPLSPNSVTERWHGRLDGMHFAARVHLSMDLPGLHEEREILVWRTDEAAGEERVLVRFIAPESVRNLGVLFLEQEGRSNDYFLYQPSFHRVRRLPETVANDDVYGIDLEFLGFGVAQSEPTELESMATETLDGHKTYRVEERALRKNPRFETRTTWLDAETFIPVRTEQHRRGSLRLSAKTTEIRAVQGVPTPMRIDFENHQDHRKVSMRVAEVDYRGAIPDEYFSTLALVRAKLNGSSASEKPEAAPGR
jgi:Outer membrane lipoprotein-sorting protein